MRKIISIVFYLLLISLAVSFAVLNSNTVSVNLYGKILTLPLSILLTLTLGIGLLLGSLIFIYKYLRLKCAYNTLNNILQNREKKLQEMALEHPFIDK